MTRFNIQEIKQAFDNIGVQSGDTLFVHSSLRKFGVPNGHSIRDLPKLLFDGLLNAIGPKGSLAVPTFNFDFAGGSVFDRSKTPSKGMGAFSEYIRTHSDSLRSSHPMQSISVVGMSREFIVGEDTLTAFEKNSAFDRLIQLDAKVLLLGATFDTVSFIHTADEIVCPPYRYLKEFSGEYVDYDGEEQYKTYAMLVRDLELDPQINKFHIEHVLGYQRKLATGFIGAGKVQMFSARDFVKIAVDCMKSNPYFFVENHKEFEMYIH